MGNDVILDTVSRSINLSDIILEDIYTISLIKDQNYLRVNNLYSHIN